MSISEKIKLKFLKRKSNALQPRKVVLQRPELFTRILIISNNMNEQLIKSAETKYNNAEVNALYHRKEKEDKSSKFRYTVHTSDFNLTGHLKNDKLTKLLLSEFDLVIDLSSDSVLLMSLLQQLKTTLIIGKFAQPENSAYDLFFDGATNDEEFLNLTVKQLNQLVKK